MRFLSLRTELDSMRFLSLRTELDSMRFLSLRTELDSTSMRFLRTEHDSMRFLRTELDSASRGKRQQHRVGKPRPEQDCSTEERRGKRQQSRKAVRLEVDSLEQRPCERAEEEQAARAAQPQHRVQVQLHRLAERAHLRELELEVALACGCIRQGQL